MDRHLRQRQKLAKLNSTSRQKSKGSTEIISRKQNSHISSSPKKAKSKTTEPENPWGQRRQQNRKQTTYRQFVVNHKNSPYDVYIGRKSHGAPEAPTYKWGNPFNKRDDPVKASRLANFRTWVLKDQDFCRMVRKELKGKVLGCWCAPQRCHGDILAEIANSSEFSYLENDLNIESLHEQHKKQIQKGRHPKRRYRGSSQLSEPHSKPEPVQFQELSQSPFRRFVVHNRKSPFDVYIGRKSGGAPNVSSYKWGNPFPVRGKITRCISIQKFREYMLEKPDMCRMARAELKGKILGCWCSPLACHGDVLAEIANSDDFAHFDEETR